MAPQYLLAALALTVPVAFGTNYSNFGAIPLTQGSILAARLGDGTFAAATRTTMMTWYLEEWLLPTTASGTASLLQTIPLVDPVYASTTYCNQIGSSATSNIHGFMSPAADGSHVVFGCFNLTVGASKNWQLQLGQVFPSGAVNLINAPVYVGSNAYEWASISAFNASSYYFSVTGGSGNSNTMYFLNPVVNPTGFPGKVGVTGTGATTFQWGQTRTLQAYWSNGVRQLYVAEAGNMTAGSGTGVNFQGLNMFASPPTQGATMNGWTASQYTALGTGRMVEPRGVVLQPSTGTPNTIWIAENTAGLYKFSGSGSSWTASGPYAISGETGYAGVVVSSDGSTVYVAANKGIYALSASTLSWLSSSPVVTSPGTGANTAVYRGLAPSFGLTAVAASPSISTTPTFTATPTSTSTSSSTGTPAVTPSGVGIPSITASPSNSATITASASATRSNTGSASGTRTNTPSSSATRSNTGSATTTASNTPSASITPTNTPSSSVTPTITPTPTTTASGTATPNGPLSYATQIIVRLGDGTAAPDVAKTANLYLEEWSLPSSPGADAPFLLQTLTFPNTCTAVPTSASTQQGFLTRSADSSHLVTGCYATTAGSNKPAAGYLVQVFTNGQPTMLSAPVYAGNTAYEYGGIAAFNASAYWFASIGGSVNGNDLQFWNPNNAAVLAAPYRVSTYGTGAFAWGNVRGLMAYNAGSSGNRLYMTIAGNSTQGSSPYTFITGLNYFSSLSTSPNVMNPWSTATMPAGMNLLPNSEPRGFVIAPLKSGETTPQTIYITDFNAGLFRYTVNGGGWTQAGPFKPSSTEASYSGVSLSADGAALYVTARGGVYGMVAANMTWFSSTPLVASISYGAGWSSVYRGIALSVASPTPSPSMTPSITPSSSATSSVSATPTLSATPSYTPSSSNTPSHSPTPSSSHTVGGTPTSTSSQTASSSNTASNSGTPTSTPTQTKTSSRTSTPSPSATTSSTSTQTPTMTPRGSLSYDSQLTLRIGDGSTSSTATTTTTLFLEEWRMPRAAGENATLIQTLAFPSTCTAIPSSATTIQGFLSRAADGSHLAFSCYSTGAGANKPATVQIGTLFPDGNPALLPTAISGTNAAYELAGIAPVNSSYYFATAVGGSANGNGLYSWVPPATFLSKAGVSGTAVTSFSGWGNARAPLALPIVGWPLQLFVAFAGTVTAPPSTSFPTVAGTLQFNTTPGVLVDPWNVAQYAPLGLDFNEPRGFVVVPGANGAPPSTIWATDASTGLYRFSLDATAGSWEESGPFAVASETFYSGVSLSSDKLFAYVSGNNGVYAFSTSSLSWLSSRPVVFSTISGVGVQSIFRGIALSPAKPSPTPTSSVTPSITPSASITASESGTPSRTPSITGSPSSTQSSGATPSITGTHTPSPSATGTQTPTNTGSSSATSTMTASGTATPSSSLTATTSKTGTPTPSQTPSSVNRPLTYGSAIVFRIGSGSIASTTTTAQQAYLDEYALPTTALQAAATGGTLLQTIALPAACTLAPANTAHGVITLSADSSHDVFACFSNSVGATPSTPQMGRLFPNGGVTMTSLAGISNTAYYPTGIASFNLSWSFFTMTGGSGSNGLWYWNNQLGFQHQDSATISTAQWGQFGALFPSPSNSRAGLYVALTGSIVSGSTTLAGHLFFPSTPSYPSALDPLATGSNAEQPLNTNTTTPRGFVLVPPVFPESLPSIMYATDLNLGVWKASYNSHTNTWTQVAWGIAIPGETNYQGVSLSLDASTLYVTASHGIYAYAVATDTWLSISPVVTAAGSGTTQAQFRGIALSPATPPPTPTQTPTMTASASQTTTPTTTASQTASHTYGLTPSGTSSLTGSSSNTPTNSPTASNTPSLTASPLSPNPVSVRIATQGTGQCLNFVELFAMTVDGRDVAATAAGATVMLSSTFGSNVATFGGDLMADPYAAAASGAYVNSACYNATDFYQANFPPAPGYPAGLPVKIAAVHFVNRLDGGFATRITSSHGMVQLFGANGSMVGARNIQVASSLSTYNFNAYNAVPAPLASDPWQSDATARNLNVRYIRVAAAAGQCLHFRELFVFDTSYTNVALGKATSASTQRTADALKYTPDMAVNGVIDMDNATTGDMTYSADCTGAAWWQVDLGGLYNLTKVVLFNRFPFTSPTTTGSALGARLNGATLSYLNYAGLTIGVQPLNGSMIQTYAVATYAPTASPSATPPSTASSTASVSMSSSVSASPSGSATASLSGAPTVSVTNTPPRTITKTPSGTAAVTRTSTMSNTPSVSASGSGSGTAASTGTPTTPQTSTATGTPSSSSSGSESGSPSSTLTPSRPPSQSITRTGSKTASNTRTGTGTRTPSPSGSSSQTGTPAVTSTPAATSSGTAASTGSPTGSKTGSAPPTGSRTGTPVSTGTQTPSVPATPTKTNSKTATSSKSATKTPTSSKTATPSKSGSKSPTKTRTMSSSPTKTRTPSRKGKLLA